MKAYTYEASVSNYSIFFNEKNNNYTLILRDNIEQIQDYHNNNQLQYDEYSIIIENFVSIEWIESNFDSQLQAAKRKNFLENLNTSQTMLKNQAKLDYLYLLNI